MYNHDGVPGVLFPCKCWILQINPEVRALRCDLCYSCVNVMWRAAVENETWQGSNACTWSPCVCTGMLLNPDQKRCKIFLLPLRDAYLAQSNFWVQNARIVNLANFFFLWLIFFSVDINCLSNILSAIYHLQFVYVVSLVWHNKWHYNDEKQTTVCKAKAVSIYFSFI